MAASSTVGTPSDSASSFLRTASAAASICACVIRPLSSAELRNIERSVGMNDQDENTTRRLDSFGYIGLPTGEQGLRICVSGKNFWRLSTKCIQAKGLTHSSPGQS